MNRVDRLFGLLVFLQSKRYVSAEEIAERFEISVRTVYRDVRALSEQGVPVVFEQNRGYCILQGFFLPPVSFTTDEANALLLSEQVVRGFTDKSILQHYGTALTKVKSVLRSTQKVDAEDLGARMHLQLPSRLLADVDHLSPLQQAISRRLQVCIDYCNAGGETSTRVIEPVGLIFYAFSWHVIAWCALRSAYRDFKVQRIAMLEVQTSSFEREHTVNMADYLQDLPVKW
jgi:predicted DNA-binding transcriptional regulator YafY